MFKVHYKAHGKELALTVSDYFLALMLILNCHSMYERSGGINFHIYELTLFSIFLNFAVKVALRDGKMKVLPNIASIAIAYTFIVVMLILICVSPEEWFSFSARFLAAPFVILFSDFGNTEKERHEIYVAFVRLTTIIAFVSVIMWFFGSCLHILSPTGIFRFRWSASGRLTAARSYYHIYFETQYADILRKTSFFGWRNSSIFTEGPMFALVLNIALLFYYVFKDTWNLSKGILYILLAGVITSFSITSYFIAAFIIYLQISRKNKYTIPILIVVILAGSAYLMLNKSGTGSFFWRMDDYRSGLITWLQSPLIGHGYNNWDAISKNKLFLSNVGYSNSLFSILCGGGILWFGLYFYPIMKGFHKNERSRRVISVIYLILLVSTIFQTTFINFYLWSLLLEHDKLSGPAVSIST